MDHKETKLVPGFNPEPQATNYDQSQKLVTSPVTGPLLPHLTQRSPFSGYERRESGVYAPKGYASIEASESRKEPKVEVDPQLKALAEENKQVLGSEPFGYKLANSIIGFIKRYPFVAALGAASVPFVAACATPSSAEVQDYKQPAHVDQNPSRVPGSFRQNHDDQSPIESDTPVRHTQAVQAYDYNADTFVASCNAEDHLIQDRNATTHRIVIQGVEIGFLNQTKGLASLNTPDYNNKVKASLDKRGQFVNRFKGTTYRVDNEVKQIILPDSEKYRGQTAVQVLNDATTAKDANGNLILPEPIRNLSDPNSEYLIRYYFTTLDPEISLANYPYSSPNIGYVRGETSETRYGQAIVPSRYILQPEGFAPEDIQVVLDHEFAHAIGHNHIFLNPNQITNDQTAYNRQPKFYDSSDIKGHCANTTADIRTTPIAVPTLPAGWKRSYIQEVVKNSTLNTILYLPDTQLVAALIEPSIAIAQELPANIINFASIAAAAQNPNFRIAA